jgi:hypothetical protein
MTSPPTPVKKDPASGALVLAALGLCTGGFLALVGLGIGVHALVQAIRRPQAHRRKGTAIVAIAANLCVLYVSAVALHSLLRAKPSALEAATLGDIRTMISAQAAYSEGNDGRYEPRLGCLAAPATCLPEYPKDGLPFLDPVLASLEAKAGYRRAFYPGPPAAPRPGTGGRSRPPGVLSFAYTAVPVAYEGMRGFCGDATGLICFTRDGREPSVTPEGRCDLSTCKELR